MNANTNRRRTSLRLLFELLAVGVFPALKPLLAALREVIEDDGANVEPPHPNLAVLMPFVKYAAGDVLLVSPPVFNFSSDEYDCMFSPSSFLPYLLF